MMRRTITLSFDWMLSIALTQLNLPAPRYEFEESAEGFFVAKIFFSHKGSSPGETLVSEIFGISTINSDDAKEKAAFQALDALKIIYDLQIVDYNYKDMVKYKRDYEQLLVKYRALQNKHDVMLKALKKVGTVGLGFHGRD